MIYYIDSVYFSSLHIEAEFLSVQDRVPKLTVLYLPAYFLFLELYPFTPN